VSKGSTGWKQVVLETSRDVTERRDRPFIGDQGSPVVLIYGNGGEFDFNPYFHWMDFPAWIGCIFLDAFLDAFSCFGGPIPDPKRTAKFPTAPNGVWAKDSSAATESLAGAAGCENPTPAGCSKTVHSFFELM